MNRKYLSKLPVVAIRLILSTFLVSLFFIATQDFHIFPGLYSGLFASKSINPPSEVEAFKISSADGHSVPVWRVKGSPGPRSKVALLFHGNAETLQSFSHVQTWLKSLGVTSYALEYRGYSGTSGWPSELGFRLDGEAAFEFLLREEKLKPDEILVLGSSIGTGPAAYVAQKYSAGALVLLAPYTSLTDLIKEMPLLGLLAPFMWYQFPTKQYISELSNTCLVLTHGKNDSTIPFHHSEQLKKLYNGTGSITFVASETAGHNNLLYWTRKELGKAINNCFEKSQ